MRTEKIRAWTYLFIAASAFVFVAIGGSALLYLFGVALLWIAIALLFFLLGAIAVMFYPPPIMDVLLQILDGVQVLLDDRFRLQAVPGHQQTRTVAPPRPLSEFNLEPVIVFSPVRSASEHYLIMIRAAEGPNQYVKSWSADGFAIDTTEEADFAQRFGSAYRAKCLAWMLYLLCQRESKVEVVAVSPASVPAS